MTVAHEKIEIERKFDAPVSLVWRAWTEPALRQRWQNPSSTWTMVFDNYDLRPGGTEVCHCGPGEEMTVHFTAHYPEVVPERRIVFTTITADNENVASVAATSVEFEPDDGRTTMRFVESIAFIDGRETVADRTMGTKTSIDKLADVVAAEAAKR
ncbi:SRPBCC domain-containing protein [Roseitalea porphyridii]|nr:SRPBCC domain-containing protein [Roseitalea porphyridii]